MTRSGTLCWSASSPELMGSGVILRAAFDHNDETRDGRSAGSMDNHLRHERPSNNVELVPREWPCPLRGTGRRIPTMGCEVLGFLDGSDGD